MFYRQIAPRRNARNSGEGRCPGKAETKGWPSTEDEHARTRSTRRTGETRPLVRVLFSCRVHRNRRSKESMNRVGGSPHSRRLARVLPFSLRPPCYPLSASAVAQSGWHTRANLVHSRDTLEFRVSREQTPERCTSRSTVLLFEPHPGRTTHGGVPREDRLGG